jgi:hypothetical protein
MGLQGSAFLALWNDVDPARDAEYNCWHTFEHVPERVGIKGFCAGRRYIARERTDDRYFTLYELDDLSALSGADYADVVDRPTEWSRSMRPSLRNFQRTPCITLLTLGTGSASGVATFRIGVRDALNVAGLNTVRSALESHLESSGIASVHLGLVDADARFPLKNAPSADSSADGIAYVLIVEGIDRGELDAAAPRIVETIDRCFHPMRAVSWKSFDFAFAIERSALRHLTTQRQPARADLHQRWTSGR